MICQLNLVQALFHMFTYKFKFPVIIHKLWQFLIIHKWNFGHYSFPPTHQYPWYGIPYMYRKCSELNSCKFVRFQCNRGKGKFQWSISTFKLNRALRIQMKQAKMRSHLWTTYTFPSTIHHWNTIRLMYMYLHITYVS